MNYRFVLADFVLYILRNTFGNFVPSPPSGGYKPPPDDTCSPRKNPIIIKTITTTPHGKRKLPSKTDRLSQLIYAANVTITIIGYFVILSTVVVTGNYIHGRLSHEYYRSCNSTIFTVMFFKNSMYCHVINMCVSLFEVNVLNMARMII